MVLDLTQYKLLSFDIYATLIDWEPGIYEALQPLVGQLPPQSEYRGKTPEETRKLVLRAFSAQERALQQEQPTLPYNKLLSETYKRLAPQLNVKATGTDAQKFGESIGSYPAFPDTVAAMQTLSRHYKLVPLSNVDNANFARTLSGPLSGVKFDAIYTAEDIGSYKPSLNNFHYLIDHVERDFGIKKQEILHTAQSLTHDHVPAKEIGLAPGVWIARAGGEGEGSAMGGHRGELEAEGKIQLGAIYGTLGEMAEDVERAFRAGAEGEK
jgi:2-haloalkanoic acid dehalogenase type II